MTAAPSGDFREAPTARRVLGRAFDLDIRSSRDLRNASLFMAAQFLFVVGPLALVLAVLFIRLPDYVELFDPNLFDPETVEDLTLPAVAFFTQAMLGAFIATLGWIAITIESQIIAITLLAGRLVGRPVTLRQAVARSRQTFWRMVRAAVLIGVPAVVAGAALEGTVGLAMDPFSEGFTLIKLAVGVAVAIPFAYVPAAIVLGNVGARESIVRGLRLVRGRWRLAVVIALFTAAAQFLQLFAIGAGGDIVVRVGLGLDLGFDHGPAAAALTYGLIIASIVALGTLLFTTIAIAAAPQVVAFVALTHVHVGLDRALEPAPAPAPATEAPDGDVPVSPRQTFWEQPPVEVSEHRLVSIPMIVGGVLAVVLALAALSGIPQLG